MNRNEIIVIHGEDIVAMTRRLLEEADLASMIGEQRKRIGIKPNLVGAYPAEDGATTHPAIVEELIRYLQENGFRDITILEGSWVGDRTEDAFEVCGYTALAKAYDVRLVDTQKDTAHEEDCEGIKLWICDSVRSIDFLINVPVLKGHCQTRMTCALKNMKGLIPNKEKRRFHTMGLHKPIAHLNTRIRQDFILVDSICGDWDFEDGGNPVVTNRMYAAKDPVLCDAFGCRLLSREVSEVPYIGMAEALGAGSADLAHADIRYLNAPKSGTGEAPAASRVLRLAEKAEEIDSCSACYGYLIPALVMLDREGLLDQLDEKVCLGQGYRGLTGTLGIGTCTREFSCNLLGCPPVESEIYEFLKDYILKKKKDET